MLEVSSSTQRISESVIALTVRYPLMEVELELELEVLAVFSLPEWFLFLPVYLSLIELSFDY